MSEGTNNASTLQQFVTKNSRKVESIHEKASRESGRLADPEDASFVDLTQYFNNISAAILRLRHLRCQAKAILDNILNRYPTHLRSQLSDRERVGLEKLISDVAQEYVAVNENYERLIYGLEDIQTECSKSIKSQSVQLSEHQADTLIRILEKANAERRLSAEAKEILSSLNEARSSFESQKEIDPEDELPNKDSIN